MMKYTSFLGTSEIQISCSPFDPQNYKNNSILSLAWRLKFSHELSQIQFLHWVLLNFTANYFAKIALDNHAIKS